MDKKDKTLCWSCENTNRYKCSWFDFPPKEVVGWIADKTFIMNYDTAGAPTFCESYLVRKCPNYDPIPHRHIKREKLCEEQKVIKIYLSEKQKRILGAALRNCRLEMGMTQEEFGKLIGKERYIVAAYECGRSQYDVDAVKKRFPKIDEYIKEEKEKNGLD